MNIYFQDYRLNSGRQHAIEKLVKMGRKEGYKLTDEEILTKYPEVARRLREGLSICDAAGVCGVSACTVQKGMIWHM